MILNQLIDELPIAVIDFETTGLYAGPDRIVEAAVVRIEPGEEPTLAFDSLIRPGRPVGATFIHGITEADVADAPTFDDVAGEFVRALSGCVVAAYNASFDMSFLRAELATVGIRHAPPHMCLMYLRQLLDIGRVCKLGLACRAHGVRLNGAHSAAGDALATADLWFHYLPAMKAKKVRTYGDMARLKSYQFTKSFDRAPLPAGLADGRAAGQTKSRFREAFA
ncbi:MAG: 3'-5' exonuclease [Gemmataceae bacterium]|nr:3'-5' exonuclease [Gemmataceae bacterium]